MSEKSDTNEEITTYSPPIEEQIPIPLDGTGEIEFTKLNEKVIIQRVAKDLYKNASSGQRELVENSYRAVTRAITECGEEKPLVRVTMNKATRSLVISDNGIGISEQRFQKVLRVLGTSDNLDGKTTGQFGMGFASYLTLSSVIIIDTLTANGDSWKRIAKDGMSFQKIGKSSSRTERGTTLSMTCYEKINFDDLVTALERVAKYASVPIVIELAGWDYYPNRFVEGANLIEQVNFDEAAKDLKADYNDIIDIETDDFHLVALVGVNVHTSRYDDNVHLLNVPIESNIDIPFDWWVLNIKDERKFMPMPERDRMREESDEHMNRLLSHAIKKHFLSLNIENYQEFLDSDRRNEFLWLCIHSDWRPVHLNTIAIQLVTTKVRDVKYDVKKFTDIPLVYKLAKNHYVVYQGYKNKDVSEKIEGLMPNYSLITTKKTKSWRDDVKFMENFGIPQAKQILIDNKVKMPKSEGKSEFELVGHTNALSDSNRFYGNNYETDVVDLDSIDENVIRIDSIPMRGVMRYARLYKNKYTFVRNAIELDDYDSVDYSDWLKNTVPKIVCATNKGLMTIEELGKKMRDVDSEDVQFISSWEPEYIAYVEPESVRKNKFDSDILVFGIQHLLPFVMYMNPECDYKKNVFSSEVGIPNSVQEVSIDEYIDEKFGFKLNDKSELTFMATHMKDVAPCFYHMLGNMMDVNTSYGTTDEEEKSLFGKCVDLMKTLEPFDDKDEIKKLEFHINLISGIKENDDEDNVDAKMRNVAETMINTSKLVIFDNEYLSAKFMKEVALKKIFGSTHFRKMERQLYDGSRYGHSYKVSLATSDKKFNFKDDMRVWGFSLQFTGFKMRINKGYCGIQMMVDLST